MRKALYTGIGLAAALFLVTSCTSYSVYTRDFRAGKALFEAGRYSEARGYFEEASRHNIDWAAFTYLSAIAYKEGDYRQAVALSTQAAVTSPDMLSTLRMYGYRALALLATNDPDGMKALKDYIQCYGGLYPLTSIDDVKTMARTGIVDIVVLERLMDEQIAWYEKEMGLYITNGVGFYSRDRAENF